MIPHEIIKKIRYIEIKTKNIVNNIFGGEYHSAFKGMGMEFAEVREYYPGDDVRAIDWNVTARTGHPYIKKYDEERELTVVLLIDVSASGIYGTGVLLKSDIIIELASILSFSAIKNHDKVGHLLFSDRIEKIIDLLQKKSKIDYRKYKFILFSYTNFPISAGLASSSSSSSGSSIISIPFVFVF